MRAEQLLETVKEILKLRGERYGDPYTNFNRIVKRWEKHIDGEISVEQHCLMMIELKMARLEQTPSDTDSIIDIIGYASILYELITED